MCLAIPAKVIKIDNGMGTIDMEGTQREVSLLLLEDVKIGEYVIVHAGFAIHRIDEAEARESLKVLRELASLVDQEGGSRKFS
ncbi:MAG: HypC/HybG/HupF family hydrogenase formation chaperone [Desulfobacterales bacterium]|nr:HypC/HybG/HupF family hydrogenase formation chaperone [Desulfobacterales bacterium]